MRFKKSLLLLFIAVLISLLQSCGIYSFSGASIPVEMKTVTVLFFENNAPSVVPNLSYSFTKALEQKVRNESGLALVRVGGDATFEGQITDYSIKPVAVEGSAIASLNRLTISIKVKFTNAVKPEYSFEESFTRYIDFRNPIQMQNQSIQKVNSMLVDDIYNRAFANW